MAPTVERVTDIPNMALGEGPHWDLESQSLYFVDIINKTINKYVPSTGQHTKVQLEKSASIIIPVKGKDNQFVSGFGKDVVIITWDGQSEKVSKIEKIGEIQPENKNHLNDGKCDSKGRLWIGTIDAGIEVSEYLNPDQSKENNGILISLDNKNITTQVTKIGCSNGLAFNKQEDKFYYIDSISRTVAAFDFDLEKGTLSNRTTIFTLSKHGVEGSPDGMTIDKDDNLWVAIFGGSSVLKIDPRKSETLLQTVKIPGLQVASVTWGGRNLDELYVTTAAFSFHGQELLPPIHGAVYKVTNLGTGGLPAENFVL